MKSRQYTIRQVPEAVDAALRRRAKSSGKSMNTVLLEALQESAGMEETAAKYNDLDHLAGTWQEDGAFDAAMKDFDRIDEVDWS